MLINLQTCLELKQIFNSCPFSVPESHPETHIEFRYFSVVYQSISSWYFACLSWLWKDTNQLHFRMSPSYCLIFSCDWSKLWHFWQEYQKNIVMSISIHYLSIKQFIISVCLITCDLVKLGLMFFHCEVAPFPFLADRYFF